MKHLKTLFWSILIANIHIEKSLFAEKSKGRPKLRGSSFKAWRLQIIFQPSSNMARSRCHDLFDSVRSVVIGSLTAAICSVDPSIYLSPGKGKVTFSDQTSQ